MLTIETKDLKISDKLKRKIQFAEEMILSQESLDKKCALDYIVDSLQYLVSIQTGDTIKKNIPTQLFLYAIIKMK